MSITDAPYLYVYGLLRAGASAPVGVPAVAAPGTEPHLIAIGPFAALVSPLTEPELLATRRHMLAHTKVIEAAMETDAILPMRFGVIVDHAGHIGDAILPKADQLSAMLDELDDRIEVGVRASWNEAILYKEIVAVRPDLGRAGAALNAKSERETYYDRIELGRQVDSAMAVKRHEEQQALLKRLRPFAVREQLLKEGDDMNVLNVALLVDRAKEAAIVAELNAIDAADNARLQIKVVSPAPPYNFVRLRLEFAPPTDTPLKGAA